jgi:anaerobic magnesium-protoporphyrin IX monomethyl ester cyclase
MRFLLVYPQGDAPPDRPLMTELDVPPGPSMLGAHLRGLGHVVDVLVVTRRTPRSEVDGFVDAMAPDLIGFYAVSPQYDLASAVARHLTGRSSCPYLLVGGSLPRSAPDLVADGTWDCVCTGEGERPVATLLRMLGEGREPKNIPGLWFRRQDEIERNPPEPLLENIDELPFMMRDVWKKWVRLPDLAQVVPISRGCPFHCAHCCNHVIHRGSRGTYGVHRSPGRIVRELASLLEASPTTREIFLEGETITANPRWFHDLTLALEDFQRQRPSPVPLRVNLSPMPEQDWDHLLGACRRANIRGIHLGVESGSERVRESSLLRRHSNHTIARIADACRRHGIWLAYQLLVGILGETPEDFESTIALCRSTAPDAAFLSIVEYYPGTELHRRAQEQGLLDGFHPTRSRRSRAAVDLPGFPAAAIQEAYRSFHQRALGRQPGDPQLDFLRSVGVDVTEIASTMGSVRRDPTWRRIPEAW